MAAVQNSVLAESTQAFVKVETRVIRWAAQSKRQSEEVALASAALERNRGASSTLRAAEEGRRFHGERRLGRKDRLLLMRKQAEERAARGAQRREKLRSRRGAGIVRTCNRCALIYRGDVCMRCKNDPELLTARGKQSRSGPAREAQLRIVSSLSPDAQLIDEIIAGVIPAWASNALKRAYLWGESTDKSADDLTIPAGHFVARVKASIWHVARALADRGALDV
jgi:hypothetical protein